MGHIDETQRFSGDEHNGSTTCRFFFMLNLKKDPCQTSYRFTRHPMRDHGADNPADNQLALLAGEVFDSLAVQFPICMASDEFHYFPQAKARTFDWSRWDDFSPPALADVIGSLTRWEHDLGPHLGPSSSSANAIDAAMLRRVIRTLREQLARVKVHETQPTFYLTIVGIGLAEALEDGSRALAARLKHLPGFLDQAIGNLNCIPGLFRDLGIDMLIKQRHWLASLQLSEACRAPISDACQRLDAHLRRVPVVENFLLPTRLYEQIAVAHMGCSLAPDEIERELALEITETRQILDQSAASMAPGRSWQTVVDRLPQPPMPPGGAQQLFSNTISELARHCASQGLIAAEEAGQCPVTVQGIPEYMRPVRSNAAYSMPPIHPPEGGTFFILETGQAAPIPADHRLLTAHETYPGHHLLDSRRWRHPRPVRRHIEFPIFYEGWASFAEELMFDTGFFGGPVDRMLMAKRRFWRAVRGQIDFEIQMRRRTLDEAAAFLAAQGMDRGRATAMVQRYSLKPGYQLAYTIGRRRFRRLYDESGRRGTDPVDFARRVLAQGEIGFNHLEQILQQGG